MSKPTISMIAGIGKNRELGEGDKLIWRIPEDLKRFKAITTGHPIIMGRKTFESIGRALPNRTNIVVTRDPNYNSEGVTICNAVEQAIEKAKGTLGGEEIFIIGGGQIYNLAIKFADKLYLTLFDSQNPNADTFFPEYKEFDKITFEEKGENEGLRYKFVNLEKSS